MYVALLAKTANRTVFFTKRIEKSYQRYDVFANILLYCIMIQNLQLMNNQKSTCSLKDADAAFFPLMDLSISNHLHKVPEAALGQRVIGVAKLPIVVSQRIFCKGYEGITYWGSNELEFSFMDPGEVISHEKVFDYWESLICRIQKRHNPIIWSFVPKEAYEIIFSKCSCGQGMFYYHEKTQEKLGEQNFLLTLSERLKTYRLSIREILPAN